MPASCYKGPQHLHPYDTPPCLRGQPLTQSPFSAAEESNKKHPFPCPTTYRTALTYYLDITNPPRTNVLYELAQYASEPSEQEHLHKMASSSGEGKVSLHAPPPHPHPAFLPVTHPGSPTFLLHLPRSCT